jgi:hypothetical protein
MEIAVPQGLTRRACEDAARIIMRRDPGCEIDVVQAKALTERGVESVDRRRGDHLDAQDARAPCFGQESADRRAAHGQTLGDRFLRLLFDVVEVGGGQHECPVARRRGRTHNVRVARHQARRSTASRVAISGWRGASGRGLARRHVTGR